jgi:hypothetical protein
MVVDSDVAIVRVKMISSIARMVVCSWVDRVVVRMCL